MSYLISVDVGMAQTKYAYLHPRTSEVNKGVFKTICSEYDPFVLQTPDCLVTFDNQLYVVGDRESQHALPRDNTKLTLTHQRCVFVAIAKALTELNIPLQQTLSIHLLLNVPLEEYRDKTRLNDYKTTYEGKVVKMELNHQPIQFVIDELELNYEGQGTIFHLCQQHNELTKGLVCLSEIGGLNDSCICFSSLRPLPNGNRAMSNGVLRLFYQVACELSQNPQNGRLTKFDVERMLKNEHEFMAIDFESVYQRQAQRLVHEIRENILNNVNSPAQTTFVFSGGGANALEPQLKEAFKTYRCIFLPEAQYHNVVGMLEYAIYKESKQAE